ncbi:MAG: hypothetical protein ACFNJN_06035 [Capnocytophaga ochracea]
MPISLSLTILRILPQSISTPTGTTKIGKYYFNHSFMIPGLIGVAVACLVGIGLAQVLIR